MGHLDSQRSLPAIGADKTGFSPLAKKLRLVAGNRVLVLNAPPGYAALLRPGPSDIATEAQQDHVYDAVLLFVKDVDELRQRGPAAISAARPNGLLWVAYPRGGEARTQGAPDQSGRATDLPATPLWVQRDVLGEITGEKGYKPAAFVAVDETWTALRFKKV